MNDNKRKRLRLHCEQFRQEFAQQGAKDWAQVLPRDEIKQRVMAEAGAYRERVYSPLTTLRLFVGQVLSADGACQDVVGRRLSERVAAGMAECSLNTKSYCTARNRLPVALPKQLQQRIGERLEALAPAAWRWQGRAVKLFDGTTLSMPDTPSNQAAFPQPGGQKPGLGFPVARVGALVGLASGAVLDYAVAPCRGKDSGESALLRQLQGLIAPGDILLADALHATWWTMAAMQRLGADVVMPQHGARQTDFAAGIQYSKGDHLVAWPRPPRPAWMDRETYQALPVQIWMREVAVHGRVLVTTLQDGVAPPALGALYALRWNIEVDFRTIKATMAMDVLRCKSKAMIEKEIAVSLLAYNLVRWAMATTAAYAHVLPRTLSFTGAKRLLASFRDHLRQHGRQRVTFIIAIVRAHIAQMELPKRPDRVEPRARKRRPKPASLLTVPRQRAREQIMAQRA